MKVKNVISAGPYSILSIPKNKKKNSIRTNSHTRRLKQMDERKLHTKLKTKRTRARTHCLGRRSNCMICRGKIELGKVNIALSCCYGYSRQNYMNYKFVDFTAVCYCGAATLVF